MDERLSILPPTYNGYSTESLLIILDKAAEIRNTPYTDEEREWEASIPIEMKWAARRMGNEYKLTLLSKITPEEMRRNYQEYRRLNPVIPADQRKAEQEASLERLAAIS